MGGRGRKKHRRWQGKPLAESKFKEIYDTNNGSKEVGFTSNTGNPSSTIDDNYNNSKGLPTNEQQRLHGSIPAVQGNQIVDPQSARGSHSTTTALSAARQESPPIDRNMRNSYTAGIFGDATDMLTVRERQLTITNDEPAENKVPSAAHESQLVSEREESEKVSHAVDYTVKEHPESRTLKPNASPKTWLTETYETSKTTNPHTTLPVTSEIASYTSINPEAVTTATLTTVHSTIHNAPIPCTSRSSGLLSSYSTILPRQNVVSLEVSSYDQEFPSLWKQGRKPRWSVNKSLELTDTNNSQYFQNNNTSTSIILNTSHTEKNSRTDETHTSQSASQIDVKRKGGDSHCISEHDHSHLSCETNQDSFNSGTVEQKIEITSKNYTSAPCDTGSVSVAQIEHFISSIREQYQHIRETLMSSSKPLVNNSGSHRNKISLSDSDIKSEDKENSIRTNSRKTIPQPGSCKAMPKEEEISESENLKTCKDNDFNRQVPSNSNSNNETIKVSSKKSHIENDFVVTNRCSSPPGFDILETLLGSDWKREDYNSIKQENLPVNIPQINIGGITFMSPIKEKRTTAEKLSSDSSPNSSIPIRSSSSTGVVQSFGGLNNRHINEQGCGLTFFYDSNIDSDQAECMLDTRKNNDYDHVTSEIQNSGNENQDVLKDQQTKSVHDTKFHKTLSSSVVLPQINLSNSLANSSHESELQAINQMSSGSLNPDRSSAHIQNFDKVTTDSNQESLRSSTHDPLSESSISGIFPPNPNPDLTNTDMHKHQPVLTSSNNAQASTSTDFDNSLILGDNIVSSGLVLRTSTPEISERTNESHGIHISSNISESGPSTSQGEVSPNLNLKSPTTKKSLNFNNQSLKEGNMSFNDIQTKEENKGNLNQPVSTSTESQSPITNSTNLSTTKIKDQTSKKVSSSPGLPKGGGEAKIEQNLGRTQVASQDAMPCEGLKDILQSQELPIGGTGVCQDLGNLPSGQSLVKTGNEQVPERKQSEPIVRHTEEMLLGKTQGKALERIQRKQNSPEMQEEQTKGRVEETNKQRQLICRRASTIKCDKKTFPTTAALPHHPSSYPTGNRIPWPLPRLQRPPNLPVPPNTPPWRLPFYQKPLPLPPNTTPNISNQNPLLGAPIQYQCSTSRAPIRPPANMARPPFYMVGLETQHQMSAYVPPLNTPNRRISCNIPLSLEIPETSPTQNIRLSPNMPFETISQNTTGMQPLLTTVNESTQPSDTAVPLCVASGINNPPQPSSVTLPPKNLHNEFEDITERSVSLFQDKRTTPAVKTADTAFKSPSTVDESEYQPRGTVSSFQRKVGAPSFNQREVPQPFQRRGPPEHHRSNNTRPNNQARYNTSSLNLPRNKLQSQSTVCISRSHTRENLPSVQLTNTAVPESKLSQSAPALQMTKSSQIRNSTAKSFHTNDPPPFQMKEHMKSDTLWGNVYESQTRGNETTPCIGNFPTQTQNAGRRARSQNRGTNHSFQGKENFTSHQMRGNASSSLMHARGNAPSRMTQARGNASSRVTQTRGNASSRVPQGRGNEFCRVTQTRENTFSDTQAREYASSRVTQTNPLNPIKESPEIHHTQQFGYPSSQTQTPQYSSGPPVTPALSNTESLTPYQMSGLTQQYQMQSQSSHQTSIIPPAMGTNHGASQAESLRPVNPNNIPYDVRLNEAHSNREVSHSMLVPPPEIHSMQNMQMSQTVGNTWTIPEGGTGQFSNNTQDIWNTGNRLLPNNENRFSVPVSTQIGASYDQINPWQSQIARDKAQEGQKSLSKGLNTFGIESNSICYLPRDLLSNGTPEQSSNESDNFPANYADPNAFTPVRFDSSSEYAHCIDACEMWSSYPNDLNNWSDNGEIYNDGWHNGLQTQYSQDMFSESLSGQTSRSIGEHDPLLGMLETSKIRKHNTTYGVGTTVHEGRIPGFMTYGQFSAPALESATNFHGTTNSSQQIDQGVRLPSTVLTQNEWQSGQLIPSQPRVRMRWLPDQVQQVLARESWTPTQLRWLERLERNESNDWEPMPRESALSAASNPTGTALGNASGVEQQDVLETGDTHSEAHSKCDGR